MLVWNGCLLTHLMFKQANITHGSFDFALIAVCFTILSMNHHSFRFRFRLVVLLVFAGKTFFCCWNRIARGLFIFFISPMIIIHLFK